VSPLEIAGLTVFILVLYASIFSIVFGIPGTVIILIDAILYALFTEFDKIGVEILLILLLISLSAESLDFVLKMKSKTRFGTYGKGAWVPVAGSIIGAIIMTQALLGLGSFAGIFLGGFAGVVLMEIIHLRQLKPALRDGYGVIIGRFTGMFVKGFCALVMIIIALTNIYS
jgi:uncharacterized protein